MSVDQVELVISDDRYIIVNDNSKRIFTLMYDEIINYHGTSIIIRRQPSTKAELDTTILGDEEYDDKTFIFYQNILNGDIDVILYGTGNLLKYYIGYIIIQDRPTTVDNIVNVFITDYMYLLKNNNTLFESFKLKLKFEEKLVINNNEHITIVRPPVDLEDVINYDFINTISEDIILGKKCVFFKNDDKIYASIDLIKALFDPINYHNNFENDRITFGNYPVNIDEPKTLNIKWSRLPLFHFNYKVSDFKVYNNSYFYAIQYRTNKQLIQLNFNDQLKMNESNIIIIVPPPKNLVDVNYSTEVEKRFLTYDMIVNNQCLFYKIVGHDKIYANFTLIPELFNEENLENPHNRFINIDDYLLTIPSIPQEIIEHIVDSDRPIILKIPISIDINNVINVYINDDSYVFQFKKHTKLIKLYFGDRLVIDNETEPEYITVIYPPDNIRDVINYDLFEDPIIEEKKCLFFIKDKTGYDTIYKSFNIIASLIDPINSDNSNLYNLIDEYFYFRTQIKINPLIASKSLLIKNDRYIIINHSARRIFTLMYDKIIDYQGASIIIRGQPKTQKELDAAYLGDEEYDNKTFIFFQTIMGGKIQKNIFGMSDLLKYYIKYLDSFEYITIQNKPSTINKKVKVLITDYMYFLEEETVAFKLKLIYQEKLIINKKEHITIIIPPIDCKDVIYDDFIDCISDEMKMSDQCIFYKKDHDYKIYASIDLSKALFDPINHNNNVENDRIAYGFYPNLDSNTKILNITYDPNVLELIVDDFYVFNNVYSYAFQFRKSPTLIQLNFGDQLILKHESTTTLLSIVPPPEDIQNFIDTSGIIVDRKNLTDDMILNHQCIFYKINKSPDPNQIYAIFKLIPNLYSEINRYDSKNYGKYRMVNIDDYYLTLPTNHYQYSNFIKRINTLGSKPLNITNNISSDFTNMITVYINNDYYAFQMEKNDILVKLKLNYKLIKLNLGDKLIIRTKEHTLEHITIVFPPKNLTDVINYDLNNSLSECMILDKKCLFFIKKDDHNIYGSFNIIASLFDPINYYNFNNVGIYRLIDEYDYFVTNIDNNHVIAQYSDETTLPYPDETIFPEPDDSTNQYNYDHLMPDIDLDVINSSNIHNFPIITVSI